MNRAFIETQIFMDEWRAAGLVDSDLRELQRRLLAEPDAGDVISGACGIRKIRVKALNRGKRGGGRVIYKDYPKYQYLVLFFMYRKADKVDLTIGEKKEICSALKRLEGTIERLASARRTKQ